MGFGSSKRPRLPDFSFIRNILMRCTGETKFCLRIRRRTWPSIDCECSMPFPIDVIDSSTSPAVVAAPCPYPSTSMTPCPTFVPVNIFHRSTVGFLHIHGYVDGQWSIRELGATRWWRIHIYVDRAGSGADDSLYLFFVDREGWWRRRLPFAAFYG
jgi:hypothetical protein